MAFECHVVEESEGGLRRTNTLEFGLFVRQQRIKNDAMLLNWTALYHKILLEKHPFRWWQTTNDETGKKQQPEWKISITGISCIPPNVTN